MVIKLQVESRARHEIENRGVGKHGRCPTEGQTGGDPVEPHVQGARIEQLGGAGSGSEHGVGPRDVEGAGVV